MIKNLMNYLRGVEQSDDAVASEADAHVAFAAVLVEAARSDGEYADVERDRIERSLAAAFQLSAPEAQGLRLQGEAAQAAAVGQHRFTTVLKASVPHDQRVHLFEHLWMVALADGGRDAQENALMRKLAGLLYVTDVESAEARGRAERRLAAENGV